MQTQIIHYQHQDTPLQGYAAFEETTKSKRPLVLICHDWTGCNSFAQNKAQQLAQLGYVGFAVDMYGQGKCGTTKEEKSALMTPFLNDRALLLARLQAALRAAKALPEVDTTKIAAIGFCFGGLCALDLARSGENLRGVVSFHGLFMPPASLPTATIKAKILALHGYKDPMAPPEQMLAFADEMTKAQADWQVHLYGHTMHAFTNPDANDPGFGTVYSAIAAQRSWQAMTDFFNEIFI